MPVSKKELKHPHIRLEHDVDVQMNVLVSAIHKLADNIEKINECGLTEQAIVLLLHDLTKVGKRDIVKILEAAPLLAERYIKPEQNSNFAD